MIRKSFNENWHVAPRLSMFEQLGGGDAGVAVTLPHDAMLAGGRAPEGTDGSHTGYFRPGTWQYEKTFDVPQDWTSRRVTLEFEGAYRNAMVYINGAYAGQCENGYTMFHISADPFLRYGTANTVRVEVQAHADSRWYSGAGLFRPVNLLIGDLVHVTPTGLRVTTPEVDEDIAVAAVATEIVNEGISTRTVEVLMEVSDAAGAVVASDRARATVLAGERLMVRQRGYIRTPQLWSVDAPNLYSASVRVLDGTEQLDEARTTFGVRTLSLDPMRGLRVNGRSVKLRGTCIHHDNGPLGAAGFAAAEERRVALLKDAGFNAIRSAHNPISVALLEACDRLGMLVIDELFDAWTQSKTDDDVSRRFATSWEEDLDALVAKDFNHPSVVFYSIGNEIQEIGTPHGARWGRMLAERVRAQDPTRPVTNAINGMMAVMDKLPEFMAQAQQGGDSVDDGGFNTAVGQLAGMMDGLMTLPEVGDRTAESAAVLDVVGLNYAGSRYLLDHDTFPNRVVYGSETFPTEIAALWATVTDNPHVIGDFTWTGWDYLGETGIARAVYPGQDASFAAGYPWLTADCGDIDITGRRRPISFYREVVFGLRSDPYIAVQRPEHHHEARRPEAWTWTDSVASWTWDVPSGAPTTVEVYADADEIAFVLNGVELAREAVGKETPFVARAEVPYEPGTLEALAYRDGTETGRTVLLTAERPSGLRLTSDRDDLGADPQGLAFVEIAVVDEHGTVHPVQDHEISVTVTGPATLQALGTGRSSTEESFLAATCTTFAGHALAVIRSTGEAGSIEVTVSTGRYPDATLTLIARS